MINDKLNKLILLARGNRTQNEFALHCGINSASITRVLNGEYEPSPATLRKIAAKAHNGVTYNQLIIAAGIIDIDNLPPLHIPENLQDARVAFYGGVEGLNQEQIDNVSQFIEFIKNRDKK